MSASATAAVVSFGDCGRGLRTGLPFPDSAGIQLDAQPRAVHCFEVLAGSGASLAWRNATAAVLPASSSLKCAVQLRVIGGGGKNESVIRAVRYAYADRPLLCNLYASNTLPAVPFTSAGGP